MDNVFRTARYVSTCLTVYPSFSRKKILNGKFSARVLLYCCYFLGNIPETEDENLRKPLKHTILILHSTLSTSFYFRGGCARVYPYNDNHSLSRTKEKDEKFEWKLCVSERRTK